MFSIEGRVITEQEKIGFEGTNSVNVEIPTTLKKGPYILRLYSGEDIVETVKLYHN